MIIIKNNYLKMVNNVVLNKKNYNYFLINKKFFFLSYIEHNESFKNVDTSHK